jgi:hypothetical protein
MLKKTTTVFAKFAAIVSLVAVLTFNFKAEYAKATTETQEETLADKTNVDEDKVEIAVTEDSGDKDTTQGAQEGVNSDSPTIDTSSLPTDDWKNSEYKEKEALLKELNQKQISNPSKENAKQITQIREELDNLHTTLQSQRSSETPTQESPKNAPEQSKLNDAPMMNDRPLTELDAAKAKAIEKDNALKDYLKNTVTKDQATIEKLNTEAQTAYHELQAVSKKVKLQAKTNSNKNSTTLVNPQPGKVIIIDDGKTSTEVPGYGTYIDESLYTKHEVENKIIYKKNESKAFGTSEAPKQDRSFTKEEAMKHASSK